MSKRYAAVVAVPARPGKAAAITLSTTGSAGTIVTRNGTSGVLSGTFDAATNQFAVSGAGYQIVATVSGDTLKGTGTQLSEGGIPLATVGTELSLGSTLVARAATFATDTVQTWTGTAGSNAGQNCGNPVRSVTQFQFVLQSTTGAGAGGAGNYALTGHAVNDVDATQATFKGTARIDGAGAGTMTFTVDAPNDYAGGSGTLSDATWSGTYKGGSPSLCEQGTWSATRLN